MSSRDCDPADVDVQRGLRVLAERAARAGGEVARRHFGQQQEIRWKADRSEVTDVDEQAQVAVIDCICAERPDDAFIGEETMEQGHAGAESGARSDAVGEVQPSNDTLCWVIDPIDGTRNYVRGIPQYACAVAALIGGTPIVGVIYDPENDLMYSASSAEGAFLGGRQISVVQAADFRPPAAIRRAPMVAIPSTRYGKSHDLAHDWVNRMIVRNFGSAALHLAMVAAGQLDAALATNCKLWDVAAGWLIVTAADGVVTAPNGDPIFPCDVSAYANEDLPYLAAGPELHGKLVRD